MLWGRTGQKGFPRERLGRRPAVLGFYAWQYSGCPMKAGNLSESEGSDAFWVPLYSSIYLRESHVQGNRFDLENPGRYLRKSGKVETQPTEVTPFEEVERSFAFLLIPESPLYDAANCSARATVYQDIADNCLMFADGVLPHHRAATRDEDWISKASSVHHGDVSIGLSPRQVDASEMEYIEEVVWLYDKAREFYQEAINLDPSHTESYLRLSQIAHQFGEQAESVRLLSKALESSNKAVQTNCGDQIRYNERAKIHEALGLIDEAISDIVQALQIAQYEFETERLNKELERLNAKSKPKDRDS